MPWVSRPAWELIQQQLGFLQTELAETRAHLRRMQRVDAGRPENPPNPPAPRPATEAAPPEFVQLCALWETQGERLHNEGIALHRKGIPWPTIIAKLFEGTYGEPLTDGRPAEPAR